MVPSIIDVWGYDREFCSSFWKWVHKSFRIHCNTCHFLMIFWHRHALLLLVLQFFYITTNAQVSSEEAVAVYGEFESKRSILSNHLKVTGLCVHFINCLIGC